MTPGSATRLLSGRFWRRILTAHADHLLQPARAPEGRAHHDGQPALYLSATPEGCAVALRRYARPDDPPRATYPVRVEGARIVDLRDLAATEALGIDPSLRTVEWHALRARGLRSPTGDISDRVRALGLDGMLYASRSDPALTHLTLFRWNVASTGATVRRDGPPAGAVDGR